MVGTEKTADYKSAGTTVDLPRQNEKWCSSGFVILTTYCSGGFVIRRGNRQIANLPKQRWICRENGEKQNRQITNLPKQCKEWWAGTIIVPERRGIRKTKKGLEITAHAYVPEDESLQLVGGLADGAATVVGEFFVLKVYEQSQ